MQWSLRLLQSCRLEWMIHLCKVFYYNIWKDRNLFEKARDIIRETSIFCTSWLRKVYILLAKKRRKKCGRYRPYQKALEIRKLRSWNVEFSRFPRCIFFCYWFFLPFFNVPKKMLFILPRIFLSLFFYSIFFFSCVFLILYFSKSNIFRN